MGNSQKGNKSIKQEYLKLIEKKKREYFKKNEAVIFACDIRKWKEFVLEEILDAIKIHPDADWPKALEKACKSWKTVNDNKYRSNIVLFDYLQESKPASNNSSRLRRTIIKVPDNIENEQIDFEATSIFDFLNGHFDQSTHFIANIISIFHHTFYTKNSYILSISPEESYQCSSRLLHISEDLIKETKTFIMIVLQTMIYYYGGLLAKKMQENPSQMYDFILEKIISQEVHSLLLHAYKISRPQDYLNYTMKLQSLENITCSDLQIDPMFCLDKPNNVHINGYGYAIEKVKEIEDVFTPMKKLEIIGYATDMICGSVDEYWKDMPDIDQNKLVIDGDNFLSIYIYIVIKSGVKDLKGHIWLITQLARSGIQNGAMGYYLTTLEACLIQVETLNS
ncbi:hypothetical protein SteCoe_23828 [Stentor coeruleus]|uniref:VPS9 domain-containing protein n=1 Tax=Stentor coeruleus TaxID=5963 RepID=A0A1R2BIW8_9CILI|nr:hypothetical protein SteCoe_23828 [Stentor coeruleus]